MVSSYYFFAVLWNVLLNAQKFCPKLPFENRFNLHGIYLEQQTGTVNIVQRVLYLKF